MCVCGGGGGYGALNGTYLHLFKVGNNNKIKLCLTKVIFRQNSILSQPDAILSTKAIFFQTKVNSVGKIVFY